jgi:hypothetical protein
MTGAKPRPPLIPGETRVSVLPLRDIVVALPGRAEI